MTASKPQQNAHFWFVASAFSSTAIGEEDIMQRTFDREDVRGLVWGLAIALCAVLLSLAIGVLPAKAADPGKKSSIKGAADEQSWTGLYIGVGGGHANAATELDVSSAKGSWVNLDSLNSDGWLGFVQVGYDYRLPNSPFVVGAFARYYGLGESQFSLSSDLFKATIVESSIEKELQVGGRVGYAISGSTLVYVGGYWAQADLSWSLINGKVTGSERLNGYGALIGIETMIAPNISLALEATKTMFNDVDYPITKTLNLKVDNEVDAVMGRISFRP